MIACVGIIVADVIVKPVDQMPHRGHLKRVDSIELFSGGNAMTAAVNLKKMGLDSCIIGKIGCDPFGDFLQGRLIQNGVNTDGLIRDSSVQTSCSAALSGSDGERTFLHCVGANGTFSIDDINWELIYKSDIVFVTGSFLLDRFDGEQTAAFLKECKSLDKVTALDVCWDDFGRWGRLIHPAMPYIDYFLPSIEEAEQIAQKSDFTEISNTFFDWGVKSTVIKLGKKGCFARECRADAGRILPPGLNVTPVDTTGAGDSFCSGFLAALSKGFSFYECAEFANITGSLCVSQRGASTAMEPFECILKKKEGGTV